MQTKKPTIIRNDPTRKLAELDTALDAFFHVFWR